MNNLFCERFSQQRDGLIFRLKLSAVGEGVALNANQSIGEERVAGARSKRARDIESEGKFPR